MRIKEAKDRMLELVASYFGEGHVFMAGAKMARKVEPYLTVQLTGYNRGNTSIFITDKDDEYTRSHTRINASFHVNLYTKGRNLANSSEYQEYENTALEDMEDFAHYVDSEYGIDFQAKHFMTVRLDGDVEDTSALVNESTYQFRSTAVFDVEFWDEAHGYYGQNSVEIPNDSHGGKTSMVTPPFVIEEAEIKWRNKE